jgi:hypothetical protein
MGCAVAAASHVQLDCCNNERGPVIRTASTDGGPGAQAKDLTTPEPKSRNTQAGQVGLSRLERPFILVANPAQEHLCHVLPSWPALQIRSQCTHRLRVVAVHRAVVGALADFGKAATAIAGRRSIRFSEVLRISREPAPYTRCCYR